MKNVARMPLIFTEFKGSPKHEKTDEDWRKSLQPGVLSRAALTTGELRDGSFAGGELCESWEWAWTTGRKQVWCRDNGKILVLFCLGRESQTWEQAKEKLIEKQIEDRIGNKWYNRDRTCVFCPEDTGR